MKERFQDRLFAAFGVLSIALALGAVAIGSIGENTRMITISSSRAEVAAAIAHPAGTATWVAAYIELLSFGLFLAFAMWACAKLGEGVLARIASGAAIGYTTLSIASLGVLDAIAYRSGKGMGVDLATTLVAINEALFVGTWFFAVFFLLAAGPLALAGGRRALGLSAVAIAAIILVGAAASLDNAGQLAFMLWMIWVVYASAALSRRRERRPDIAAATQHA